MWRKSVLISLLIRSLVPFVLPCGCYFTWLAPSALCITLFLQAKVLINKRSEISVALHVSFAGATGTVLRKNQYPSTDSEFTFGSFLVKSCLWPYYFGEIICFIVLQCKSSQIFMSTLSYEREGLACPCDVHADLLLVVVTAVAKCLL